MLRHAAARLDSRDLLCYVGVHHKAGTVWMRRLFGSIGWRLGVPQVLLTEQAANGTQQAELADPRRVRQLDPALLTSALSSVRARRNGVLIDPHSLFAEVPRQIERIGGVHIVRDPRDLLISSTLYHLQSAETWLQTPRPRFGGISYQEKLRSAGTIRDALVFELGARSGRVTSEMAAFPALANVPTITYESLMEGNVLAAFDAMFSALGLSDRARRVALACARRESIVLNPRHRGSAHIRSGRPRQWRERFDRDLAERFVEESGDELIALGYERDHSWVERLPARLPALDEALAVA